ncbi:MAG: transglutaminase-like domain-containing protein [Peptococcaceae bacterium]
MKKVFFGKILIFALFFVFIGGQAVSAAEVNYTTVNGVKIARLSDREVKGSVKISGETSKEQIKIRVTKNNKQVWYEADLQKGCFNEEIWLTQGIGTYEIAVMVHEFANKYSYGPKFSVKSVQEVNEFLVPAKHVESNDPGIIKQAEKIVTGLTTDLEKARAIYEWVTANIQYDYVKYGKHLENNFDNQYGAVHTLLTKKGVCYDYAALTAALGRAVGLQVKVVEGQGILGTFRGFHAWNEIYITPENRWINVDTTFGAAEEKEYFDNADFNNNHL